MRRIGFKLFILTYKTVDRLFGTKMGSELNLVVGTRWKFCRMDGPVCVCLSFNQKMKACTRPSPPT